MNQTNKLKIGITVGDINGIGLEVILKTLSDKRLLNYCTPIIYGSTKVISYHKNIIKIKDLPLHNAKDASNLNPNMVNVINCWMENVKIHLGKCNEDGGKYAYLSLEQAVADLQAGHLQALVTAPINKKSMQLAGFEYPGHTEYLTSKLEAPENLMFMVNEDLRVGLVTNHLPINQVASAITKERVLTKIRLMHQSLCMDFGINRPAIAVLGLNPHAGDGGVLGSEDLEVIVPAIEAAKAEGILAIGPYAADGLFGSGNYRNFDGILAMYHDQGLVPFKALSFGKGINFTAGLPVIRTSPDHGTGFEIAGKNTADPQSFREALYLAIDSFRQRVDYTEMTKNPLNKVAVKELENEEALTEDQNEVVPNANPIPSKKHQQGQHKKGKPPHKQQAKDQRPAKKQGQRDQKKGQGQPQQKEKQPEQQKPTQQLTVEERLEQANAKRAAEKAAKAKEEAKVTAVKTPETKKQVESVVSQQETPKQEDAPASEVQNSEVVTTNENGLDHELPKQETPKDPA